MHHNIHGNRTYAVIVNILVWSSVCLLTGCGSKIFYANFKSEALGSEPSVFPPEGIKGEKIQFVAGAGKPHQLQVVDSPELGSRALLYQLTNSSSPSRGVIFRSATASKGEKLFLINWQGYKAAGDSPLYFEVESGVGMSFLFKGGKVFLNSTTVDPGKEIGTYHLNTVQTIWVIIDKGKNTFTLAIFENKVPTAEVSDQPLVDLPYIDEGTVSLTLLYTDNPPATANRVDQYLLRNLVMEQGTKKTFPGPERP